MRKTHIYLGLAIVLSIAMTLLFITVALAEVGALPYTINLFQQCRNGVAGTGPCSWTNGAIQSANSLYTEGDATPQRLHLTGVPSGPQVVAIEYEYSKAGKHAYDYLITYNYSEIWLGSSDYCSGITGCTSWASSTFPVTADPVVATAGVTQHSGNFTILNGTINGVSAPVHVGDVATQIVTFTSTTDQVLILFGGHLASSADWGIGMGSSSISGGPYHISVYGRDNNVQAGAIVPPGQLTFVKDTNIDYPRVFTFTSSTTTQTPLGTFYLEDSTTGTYSNTITFPGLLDGVYTATEHIAPGTSWDLVSIVCTGVDATTGAQITPVYSVDLTTGTVVITLALNTHVTCTFTNNGTTAVGLASLKASLANRPFGLIVALIALLFVSGGVLFKTLRKPYSKPEIVEELELETRAGSPLGFPDPDNLP